MRPSEPVRLPFLQRRYTLRLRPARGIIGIAPLADITLLLILFLLINSVLVLKPGIVLDLPTAGFAAGAPWNAAILRVTQEGSYFFKDERVRADQLGDRLKSARAIGVTDTLLIEADRRLEYERVIHLHDLARRAGYGEVILATQEESLPWPSQP